MLARYLGIITSIALLCSLLGCASTFYPDGKTSMDRNLGKSYESAKYDQILNPEADMNRQPVVELDGKASAIVLQKYWKSFEGKKGTKTYNLNLGAVESVGKGLKMPY